ISSKRFRFFSFLDIAITLCSVFRINSSTISNPSPLPAPVTTIFIILLYLNGSPPVRPKLICYTPAYCPSKKTDNPALLRPDPGRLFQKSPRMQASHQDIPPSMFLKVRADSPSPGQIPEPF